MHARVIPIGFPKAPPTIFVEQLLATGADNEVVEEEDEELAGVVKFF
jgi:hypothetical protein